MRVGVVMVMTPALVVDSYLDIEMIKGVIARRKRCCSRISCTVDYP